MKIYLLSNETLVFEGMGWGIIEVSHITTNMQIYGTHCACTIEPPDNYPLLDGSRTRPVYGEHCWAPPDTPLCAYCKEPVPEGVQALILLRAWNMQ